jgi:hypothetical protein
MTLNDIVELFSNEICDLKDSAVSDNHVSDVELNGQSLDFTGVGTGFTGSIDLTTTHPALIKTSYVCSVTQSGTATLGQTVIHNNTGVNPGAWVRSSAGVYYLDFAGVVGTFYSGMTSDWNGNAILINIHAYDGTAALDGGYMYWWDNGAKKLYLYVFDDIGAAAIDLGNLIGASALYLPKVEFYQ